MQTCVQLIKAQMPETYKSVGAKAALIGQRAFGLVRAGIRGKPNCFYAIERGHVVGTPFNMPDVSDDMARLVLQFGCTFMVMWAPEACKGAADGAH